jgi:hypothetical protein
VAHVGRCAVRLTASDSTARSLTSTPDPVGRAGDVLTLRAAVNPDDLRADARVVATVRLVGGGTQKLTLTGFPRDRAGRAGYLSRETSITLAGTVESLQVKALVGRGRGKLLLDAVSLRHQEGAGG